MSEKEITAAIFGGEHAASSGSGMHIFDIASREEVLEILKDPRGFLRRLGVEVDETTPVTASVQSIPHPAGVVFRELAAKGGGHNHPNPLRFHCGFGLGFGRNAGGHFVLLFFWCEW